MANEPEEAYNPSKYTFSIFLMCTSEDEVAEAMQKLMLPVVGLALAGINVMLTRVPDEEDKS